MTLEERIHKAEADLFHAVGAKVDESYLDLARTKLRVRLLGSGSGPPLVLLHGVSLSAAAWAPLFTALPNRRLLAIDLPGHGLSDPASYRRGHVRQHAVQLIEDVFDALKLDEAPVVGHSLGGMFALWYAATGARRISRLVAIGEPAVALPGARVRMPLSLLTVRGLGVAVLRSPSLRPVYRRMLAQGLGQAEVAASPDSLIDALRLSARRPENARTVTSLMHTIDHFRRPRADSVLTTQQPRRDRDTHHVRVGNKRAVPLRQPRPPLDRPIRHRDTSRSARRTRPLARRPRGERRADPNAPHQHHSVVIVQGMIRSSGGLSVALHRRGCRHSALVPAPRHPKETRELQKRPSTSCAIRPEAPATFITVDTCEVIGQA